MSLDLLVQHVRYAWRALMRTRAFTAMATLIVALGIGASATVFSVMDATFLKPLPYPHAERLQVIESTRKSDRISVAYPDLMDFRAMNHVYAEVAGYSGQTVTLSEPTGDAEVVRGQMVTPNLFRTLRVVPAWGRAFTDGEFVWGTPRTVILSHPLWVRRYAQDPAIVGRSITMDREPYQVVGIMPPGFDFPGGTASDASDFWIPTGLADPNDYGNRDSHPGLTGIARLKDGVSPDAARADLAAIAARLRQQYPVSNRDEGVHVAGALENLVGDLVPTLTLVSLAVLLLLLITTANMTGLLLARGVTAHRDIAVRTALGATRANIVTQLVVESLLLSLLGGVAGVGVAFAAIRVLRSMLVGLPRLADLSLDGRVVIFALALSLLTGLIFGVGPALAATGKRVDAWLRTRGPSSSVIGARGRRMLVAGEIVVSFVLVVGATMLARSFANLAAERGGIRPDGALTFAIRLPEASYPRGPKVSAFYDDLMAQLSSLPDVTAPGAISTLPFSGYGRQSGMRAVGGDPENVRTDVAAVTPGYFAAAGMELRRGRLLTAADQDLLALGVVVIDERLARRFWPNEDPLGKRIEGWGAHERTVVGVVRHVKNYGVSEQSREELFLPLAKQPISRMYTVVRTTGKPEALTPAIRRIVRSLDPQVPVSNVRTLRSVVDGTIAAPRLTSALSGLFAALSLLLSAVGLYGLLAFLVGQRTHEIGVRMALGASPAAVVRQVVQQASGLVTTGIVLGLLTSLATSQLLRSRLFGVSAVDPVSLCAVSITFVAVAALSAWIPVRRAARIDPLEALRDS